MERVRGQTKNAHCTWTKKLYLNQEHPLRMGENIFSFVAIWRMIFLLSNYVKNCQKVGKIKAFRDSDNGSNMEKNSRKYKIQTD